MKKRKKVLNETAVIRYELFEANQIMSNRNQSAFVVNTSTHLYQRVYKGNGVRLLLSKSKSVRYWTASFSTMAQDIDTKVLTVKPHVLSLAITEPCPASAAVIATSEYWIKELNAELGRLNLEAIEVQVVLRGRKNK